MTIEALRNIVVSPPPLRKKDAKLKRVYTRPRIIHEKLKELLALPRAEVLSRCEITDKNSQEYVPSECLVHLLRACRDEPTDRLFERVYKTLMGRIVHRFNAGKDNSNRPVAFQDLQIRDKVLDRFNEMLMKDRNSYFDKLDFYEVRFDRSLKLLRITVEKQVRKETNRSVPLEDPESGEVFADVDEAAGAFDPFQTESSDKKDYRSRLDAAIAILPPEQKQIVTMLRMEFPIYSENPKVMTIAKALKRSDKTIRTHRDKAFASMKAFLEKGDTQ